MGQGGWDYGAGGDKWDEDVGLGGGRWDYGAGRMGLWGRGGLVG